jgi:hypothetical protein
VSVLFTPRKEEPLVSSEEEAGRERNQVWKLFKKKKLFPLVGIMISRLSTL